MHFFVAVTFYRRNNLHQHQSRLKPTSDDLANLLRTQQINFSIWQQHVGWRTTPLSFDVSFLENPCIYPHPLYIARN